MILRLRTDKKINTFKKCIIWVTGHEWFEPCDSLTGATFPNVSPGSKSNYERNELGTISEYCKEMSLKFIDTVI